MADQSFVIRKAVALQAKIAFAVTTLISVFLAVQLTRMLRGAWHFSDLLSLSFLTIAALVFTWYFYRFVKSIPDRSVSLDDDGLWSTPKGKSVGLVRWGDIWRIREDGLQDNLTLIGQQGNTLFKVAYGLDGFKQLRAMISKRMTFQGPLLPKIFKAKPGPIVAFICLAIFNFSLAWLLFSSKESGLVILCIVFGVFFGLISISALSRKVVIENQEIRVGARVIPYSEIKSVSISDQVIRGQTFSSVKLDLSSGPFPRSLTLGALNTDSLTLQRTILWAIDNSSKPNDMLAQTTPMTTTLHMEQGLPDGKKLPIFWLLFNGISWLFVLLSLREIMFRGKLAFTLFDPVSVKFVLAFALVCGIVAGFNIVRVLGDEQKQSQNVVRH